MLQFIMMNLIIEVIVIIFISQFALQLADHSSLIAVGPGVRGRGHSRDPSDSPHTRELH